MNKTDSVNLTNEEMLAQIEKSKFESRFGYISTSYFRNVIEREKNSNPYLLIYGDFDKITEANAKYKFKKTTKYMKQTTDRIAQYLTTQLGNTECVSLGGDEFLFIVRNINKEDVPSSLLTDIENNIFNNFKLSMTLGFSHSKDYTNMQETLESAQKMAEENKIEKNKSNSVEERFGLTISRFLKAIPVNGISESEKETLLKIISEKYEDFINDEEKIIMPNYKSSGDNRQNIIAPLSDDWKNNRTEIIETLKLLHTNPQTLGIRKSPFNSMIPFLKNRPFYYCYVDISHLRLSNLLLCHEITDSDISKLIITNLLKTFSDSNITFDYQDTLDFNYSENANFIVNLSGCKIIILLSPSNPDINLDKINMILRNIQNSCSKDILGISYFIYPAQPNLTSVERFNRLTKKLAKQCEKDKIDYRKNIQLDPSISKLWLEKLVERLYIDFINSGYEPTNFQSFYQALANTLELLPKVKRGSESSFIDEYSFRESSCKKFRKDSAIQTTVSSQTSLPKGTTMEKSNITSKSKIKDIND